MTQVEILDRKRDTPQPYILDLLDKLAARQLLPVIEVTLVAVFVLVIAVDAHRKKVVRLAQSALPAPKVRTAERTASPEPPPSPTPASPVPSPAATETGASSAVPPRASPDVATGLNPILPPEIYHAGTPASEPAGASPAAQESVASPAAPDFQPRVPLTLDRPAGQPSGAASAPAGGNLAGSFAPIIPPGLYRPPAEAPATLPAASDAGPTPPTAEAARVADPASPPPPAATAVLAGSLAPILPPGLYNASSGAPATPEMPPSPPSSAASADAAGSIAPIMPPAVYRAATDAPSPQSTPPNAPLAAAEPETAAAVRSEAESEAAPGAAMTAPIVEARLHPEDAQKAALPDKQAEQKDFADAFQTASRMLERRLTSEERAASMAPDYVDAIQRIEGFYDPTRVGPFGGGLRMGIRPGTMSMTDVFGERWTRAYPDPNVHYRVGYHAETWLRPLSHKCEDFWRFRTDDSPVALDKLTPADCARIRAKTPSDTKLMADSSVVSAPLSVPAFAAPYPGGRMTHDELMAALRARASAAREKLWLGRTPGLVRPMPAKPKPALSPDEDTQTN